MPKFKVGDMVRILDGNKNKTKTNCRWRFSMNEEIGKICRIKAIRERNDGERYVLDNSVWYYVDEWLETVKE